MRSLVIFDLDGTLMDTIHDIAFSMNVILEKHGFSNFQISSTRAFETIFRIRYEILGTPKISIVIANKDHVEDLRRCVTSITEKSTYDNYEIIIVENNSESAEIFDYYADMI